MTESRPLLQNREADEQTFVERHRAYVEALAYKLRQTLHLPLSMEDLVAAGMVGLIEAHRRFDPSHGVHFRTFAYYRVRGAIIDEARRHLQHSTHMQRKLTALGSANDLLAQMAMEHAQIGRAAGVPPTAAQRVVAGRSQLDQTLSRLVVACSVVALNRHGNEASNPEEQASHREDLEALRASLDRLEARAKRIVQGYYFEGKSLDAIAGELGISKSWASRIHARALDALRRAISPRIEVNHRPKP